MSLGVPVLVCLDLQMEFVTKGRPWTDPQGERVAQVSASILSEARAANWSIVHVQLHPGGPIMADSGLHQPAPGCEPRPGEILLRRAGVSAYAHPDLSGILEGAMGAPAYLMGFSAPTSLTATLYDAEERMHPLSLIEEAVGSADVGEWSADHARALCMDTANKLHRLVSRTTLFGEKSQYALGRINMLTQPRLS